jgi:hypothetical protein
MIINDLTFAKRVCVKILERISEAGRQLNAPPAETI